MIYGAYGYTGALIAREAVARGTRPVLAGRDAGKVGTLAGELALQGRSFVLDDPAALREGLAGLTLVLHCAGPFSATARPMMAACLEAGVHYLDITGEIDVFEHAHALHARAQSAGVLLCPGVGFDVVPTDCLAMALQDALPGATRLALGFDTRGRLSPGTAKTSLEGLAKGGCVRRGGRLERVPLAYHTRRIDFGAGEKLAMTIPWGDVATAFHTTGIPDIEVYIPASPRLVSRLRRLNYVRPLLGLGLVQRWLRRRVERTVRGPDEAERARAPTCLWGEAVDPEGRTVTGRQQVANGYDVTINAALGVVARVLGGDAPAGHLTPARLMGPEFVSTLPGSGPLSIA